MLRIIDINEIKKLIKPNYTVMFGGFLGTGTPEIIVQQIILNNINNLTIIGNDTAYENKGIGKLIVNKLVKKVIVSHIGTNKETQKQIIEKELESELVPQGTLAERIRAGGVGIGGVLTSTGLGTVIENGKEKITVNEKEYLLELPLKADVAILKAKKCDKKGNLVYSLTAKNFNPLMAMAANIVIVEVEEIVPTGTIPADQIHTPGVIVDYVIKNEVNK